MNTPSLARPSAWLVGALVGAALLSGCGTADDTESTPSATASATPTAEPTTAPPAATAPEPPVGDGGPEDSFRTWLAASRTPDVETACGYMTPELAQRMVDEITAQGFPGITDCASLIELTAGLLAATGGQTTETGVEVREQTAEQAVLHVVYIEGSSCGRVVLAPGDGHWLLTERSKAEC